ncbi:MAG: DUF2304 domain-containing protein [Eggerthellaceae bacterium]|jgi:hypothetical protein|nr:DUF2304 domain-containing protein [Eggerthellaceae bacterium]
MTLTLRVVLVLVSLMTLLFVMRKVRSSKIRLEDSMAWILFSGVLFVLSVFPGIFDFLAELAGVYSTVNFVFLFFIFVLLILCFSLNMKVSQMDTKIKELTQLLAIEKFERYSNDLLKRDEGDEETGREQRLL